MSINYKIILDYDNTCINSDSDFLIGYLISKLNIFNNKIKNTYIFYYKLYEKQILNENNYINFVYKTINKIKKIKIIFDYIIKIFNNNIFFLIKRSVILTSSSCYIIDLKTKIFNNYIVNSKINLTNSKLNKILNFKKIILNSIFLSDSTNDIHYFFYNKKNLLVNSDKIIYHMNNIKKINTNFIYK
ncbi:hypothetical protein [Candidatus Carsonella ruddii]|uniref:Uncharacterized protein n=1 Tax=Carsonella ruddii TaxID=114186 RepID=A0AAE7G413_CARRU|nr:hypothetical protein [Candidatus Carsonella ruddii]AGS06523.1 hypothetical protein CRDC_00175 [Candidatus Carsonella ruddii DC]ALA96783.1 hypothetical protein AMC76_00170 [Candidatus Carsonella ruddii]QLK14005.1 hypothetical protein FK493_00165 [Candidatus Carsonella ruddii]